MTYTVVTAMNRKIFDETGKTMIESFLKYWDDGIDMIVKYQFSEGETEFPMEENSRLMFDDQLDPLISPGLADFIARNKIRPDQQNPLELHLGAVRFSYKTYAIVQTLLNWNTDRLIWLDADTVTFNPVDRDWLDSLLPEGKFIAYLGRENNYPECGFVIYDCSHPKKDTFARIWKELYDTDGVFLLPQWHDSFVFDHLRRTLLTPEDFNDLTPWGKDYQHVWLSSPLATRMDHMKGNRKIRGRSNFSDLADFKSVPNEIVERLIKK